MRSKETNTMFNNSNRSKYVSPFTEEIALPVPESLLSASGDLEQTAVLEEYVSFDLFDIL